MQNRLLYILLGLVAAILLLRASLFTVTEGKLASNPSVVKSSIRSSHRGCIFAFLW